MKENFMSVRKYQTKPLDESSHPPEDNLGDDMGKDNKSVNDLHREPERQARWRQREERSPRLAGGQSERSDHAAKQNEGLLRDEAEGMVQGGSAYQSLDQFENIAITTQSERDGSTAPLAPLAPARGGRAELPRRIAVEQIMDAPSESGWGEGLESSARPAAGGPDELEPESDSSAEADEYGDKVDAFGGRGNDDPVLKNTNIPGIVSSEWRELVEMDSLPLMKSGYSLEADMKFGWKPTVKGKVLPIPLVFDTEDDYFDLDHYIEPNNNKRTYPVIYRGWRPADSLKMYKRLLSNQDPYCGSDFPFKVPSELPPSVQKLLDQQMQETVLGAQRTPKVPAAGVGQQSNKFEGMNPAFTERYESGEILQFDSMFESGNLDRVVMVSPNEYDLYMRPDTNTRGHHQWFFFKVTSRSNIGTVRFNILNFTKPRSLYEYGMKLCICSVKEKELELARRRDKGLPTGPLEADTAGWKRGGLDAKYGLSKLNGIIQRHNQPEGGQSIISHRRLPLFYQMTFTHEFNYMDQDETYIAYSFPYTFTRLSRFMRELRENKEIMKHTNDCTPLCQSLAGVDVPYLIVTSRANEDNYRLIQKSEHEKDNCPVWQVKKTVVLTGRVHPGESNSSFMMEGFIRFITSNKPEAVELRKRLIFKIIPCTNPDGVIAGNYRVSMSGNDLNRRYQSPHAKLHPIVCAVKKLIRDEKPDLNIQDENCILAYIDMHGHSRKKNVFMYGPQFPIHDSRYLKMRVIPKLMSEKSEMFRFFSCKFRIQKSKEKTARVVLWREFNIMSCFTLEASFQGYFDQARETRDFMHSHFFKIGDMLGSTLLEFVLMREEDERQARMRRDEQKRIKIEKEKQVKLAQENLKEKKIKSSQMKKRMGPDGNRGILSPSVSSEAVINIDDQQPNNMSDKKGMHRLRKKLINSNQKKAGQTTYNSGYFKSTDKKKKFKLTKKFKDDMPAISRKKSNPNQPPDELENEEGEEDDDLEEDKRDQNNTDIQREILDEDSDGSNDSVEEKDQVDAKLQSPSSSFMDQFRLKKRTLKDLYQQIETDEKIVKPKIEEKDVQEINSSDGQEPAGQDGEEPVVKEDQNYASDAYRSDDDINEQLLQQIQGKILGVLKCDSAQVTHHNKSGTKNSNNNPSQKKNKSNKQTSETFIVQKRNPQSNEKLLVQAASQKQQPSGKKVSNQLLPLQGASSEKLVQQQQKPAKRHHPKISDARKDRLRQLPVSNPPQSVASMASHVPGQGVLLQMKNNNFNDRIMTQPYNKYQKKMYSGSSGGYHLQSLSSNTHQLFHRQYLHNPKQQPGMRQQRQGQEERPQAFSFYNFQARSNKQQMPLIQRLGDNNKDNSKLYGGSRGRQFGQEDFIQHRERNDQFDEGSSSSHQNQMIQTFGMGRSAVTHQPSHAHFHYIDSSAQKQQEQATSSQHQLKQPVGSMQLLYSTPQQTQMNKLDSQNNKYFNNAQQKPVPRAQRSAQFSQGQLTQAMMGGNDANESFQRNSRRLVPSNDVSQGQYNQNAYKPVAHTFQHTTSRLPGNLENLDKIPHHVPGILSGSGLCHEAMNQDQSNNQLGVGFRPGDASSALALGSVNNYGLYERSDNKQVRTAGLPYSYQQPMGSYEKNRSGGKVIGEVNLTHNEGANTLNKTEISGFGHGNRSTTSFTAQMHAKNKALDAFSEPAQRQLAMSSSMAVTRAQENLHERGGLKGVQTGQHEFAQIDANGMGNINETRIMNENNSFAYIDQSRIEPALKDRMPAIANNQPRITQPFPAIGQNVTGISPEKTAIGQRNTLIDRGAIPRGLNVRVDARNQMSIQGPPIREYSGRHMNNTFGQGQSQDYTNSNQLKMPQRQTMQTNQLPDSAQYKSRVKNLKQIDLNDNGVNSSNTSLIGPNAKLLTDEIGTSSGLRSVHVQGRGSIVNNGQQFGMLPGQPSSPSSQRLHRPALGQANHQKIGSSAQKGRTIDLHPQQISNARLPSDGVQQPQQQHFAHLAPVSAYSNNLVSVGQQNKSKQLITASRPQSPTDSKKVTTMTEALRNQQKAKQQMRPHN